MRLPTDGEIRDLHLALAPTAEAFDLVHTHCRIVRAVAEQLLARRDLGLDGELVRVGCLLHDVGVYRLFDGSGVLDHTGYVRHGVLGRDLLRQLGFGEAVARFCATHVGMGLTRQDVVRQRLPIPVADYLPESGEEELVLYADKFHSKTSPPTFVTADSCASRMRRFGADKAERFAVLRDRFGEPDLAGLAERYGHAVAEVRVDRRSR